MLGTRNQSLAPCNVGSWNQEPTVNLGHSKDNTFHEKGSYGKNPPFGQEKDLALTGGKMSSSPHFNNSPALLWLWELNLDLLSDLKFKGPQFLEDVGWMLPGEMHLNPRPCGIFTVSGYSHVISQSRVTNTWRMWWYVFNSQGKNHIGEWDLQVLQILDLWWYRKNIQE